MLDKAILDGKKVVPIADVLAWGRWFETADRVVKKDTLPNGKRVSTVFLGINHQFGVREPLWFETMVFPKKNYRELDMERYTTWEEAEKGHKQMIQKWITPTKKSGRRGI